MQKHMSDCDDLPDHIRTICRGEDPRIPLHDVNLNRANGFGGLIGPLPPLATLSDASNSMPPLIIRGWNFAAAMARWVLAGRPRRSQAEIDERLAICQACPFLVNDHCSECGCACVEENRLINKLALATEVCPKEKWR